MVTLLSEVPLAWFVESIDATVRGSDLHGYDGISTARLRTLTASSDAVTELVASLAAALQTRFRSLSTLQRSEPLVQAMLQVLAHPQAPASLGVLPLGEQEDLGAWLEAERKRAQVRSFDAREVARLLTEDLQAHGARAAVELDRAPWEVVWGDAGPTAYALLDLLTLNQLGWLRT